MPAVAFSCFARRYQRVKIPAISCQFARRLVSFDARSLACARQETVNLRHIYDVCSTRPVAVAPWLHQQVSGCSTLPSVTLS